MKRILAISKAMFATALYVALSPYSSAQAAQLPDIEDVLRAKVIGCARVETPQRLPPGVQLAKSAYFCNAKGSDFDVTFFELAGAHHGQELMRLCTAAREKCVEVLIGRPHQRTLQLLHYNAVDQATWIEEARTAALSSVGREYEVAMQPLYADGLDLCKDLKGAAEEPFLWVGRISEGRVDYSLISSDSKFARCFDNSLRRMATPPAPRLTRHEVKGGYPVDFVWRPEPAEKPETSRKPPEPLPNENAH